MCDGERFNGYSHLVGASLAVIGSILLIALAAQTGGSWCFM